MDKTTSKRTGKRKGILGRVVSVAIFALIGAACGGVMLRAVDGIESVSGRVLCLAGLFAAMYGAILLQIVIHEAGHFIFGRLSGYGFGSFRIFSWIWIREESKLTCRRLSLAGTDGQCLMVPPELKDGRMPVFLYNMGGALLNLISAALFFGLSLLFRGFPILAELLRMPAVMGLGVALLNGIPMRVGPVDNDGRNALALSKDAETMRAFWVQMQAAAQTAQGVRLKDMPEEWFRLPSAETMQSGVTATLGVLAANRLMDQHRFREADELMAQLLELDSVMGLHRNMMLCDRIFIELIGEERLEIVAGFRTKDFQKGLKAMRRLPSVLRTEYAQALLLEKDPEKAEKILAQFDVQTKTYPYPCEIEGERELMRIASDRCRS
jgi:hypothetical protein